MRQSDQARIVGPNLALRLIQPDDAKYVQGLRTDPAYNAHLSKVRGTADDQRAWIETYKAREAAGEEYYYIIERHNGTPCGTVRLYNIHDDSFTWGSWILDHNKPRKAALESAVLSFQIGFDRLGLMRAAIDVRTQNTHAEAFYRRFGMKEVNRSEQEVFFELPRDLFQKTLPDYLSIIGGVSS